MLYTLPDMESNAPPGTAFLPAVERFNHNLKILARDLSKRFPGDPMVFRAQKRTMAVIDVFPIFVIDSVGPYLYSYREQIYSDKDNGEEFFLENNFDAELKESINQEKADMVSYLIPKAKECARSMPPDERKEYRDLVVLMLDDDIEYLAILNGQ